MNWTDNLSNDQKEFTDPLAVILTAGCYATSFIPTFMHSNKYSHSQTLLVSYSNAWEYVF